MTQESKTKLMVVARYNESLEWLKDKPFSEFPVLIYNKGVNDHFYRPGQSEVVSLDNVGREGHTYLYHIVQHYDDLTDIIVFLPGSVDFSIKIEKGKTMVERIQETNEAVFLASCMNEIQLYYLYHFIIRSHTCSSPENNLLNPESNLEPSKIRPFGKWFNETIGLYPLIHVSYNGILSVSKKDVLQRPKSFYENLLQQLNHPNPEVGHYIERSWQAIFSMEETRIEEFG